MSDRASSSGRPVIRRLFRYLRPYRQRMAIAILSMVAYGATDGAVPFLIRSILDDVFGGKNQSLLVILPVIIVVFALARGLFAFSQQYLINAIGLNVVRDIRQEVGEKLLHLSPSFFSRYQSGELLSRVNNDTLSIRTALTEGVSSLLRDTVRMVALIGVAIYLDPFLALLALVGLPIGLYPMIRFGKKVRKHSKVGQERLGGFTNILQETILGHRVVQAFSMEKFEENRLLGENQTLTKSLVRAERYGALSGPTNEFIASIAIAVVIVYGGYSVISGIRTQGDFIAFLTALFLLYEPFKKLGRVHNAFQVSASAAERVFEILDAEVEIVDSPGAKALILTEPTVEFRQVHFRYQRTDPEYVLKDISFVVRPGETVALVGMSGGGKSTLVSLIPRFYDPQSGAIEISGHDIRTVTLQSLREQIAIVSQHTFLFNASVFHNIAYGRVSASEAEVLLAAKAANAHDFIERLPEGYQTIIGEQGFRLSGGERARIAIARALLKNAPILILDEATASLDSESEMLVQEAIDRLMKNRTGIVIAHRLATVRNAGRILVVVSGAIVESGTHQELLRKNGEYAKLYKLQFKEQLEFDDHAHGKERDVALVGVR